MVLYLISLWYRITQHGRIKSKIIVTGGLIMREIRKLDASHVDAYTEIAFNAYPSFKNFEKSAMDEYKAEVIRIMNEDPIVTFFGLFEEDELIGVMRLFDFQMNAFGKVIPVSGLGFLGVHLMHKKKKVARDLVNYYETHYLKRQIPIALLLPFRPDFYKKMGYGHGTKMNQYRIPTDQLPKYEASENYRVSYLGKQHLDDILACHGRVVLNSHGRMIKFGDEIRDLFGDAFNRVIGVYNKENQLSGYMVYHFKNGKPGNYTINHIYIKEFIHENTEVMQVLLNYLRQQQDQVALTIFNTEDENFHYLFDNPLNDSQNYIPYGYLETNTQAIGVMYKVLDPQMAFEQCQYRNYNGVDLKVKFDLIDPFTGEPSPVIVHFNHGKVVLNETSYDVTVTMSLSDFSSLFLGSVGFNGLYSLGLIKVDHIKFNRELDQAFYCPQKPVCYTDF